MSDVPSSSTLQQDYFSVFGLPRIFDLDLKDLEKRYFAIQKELHPDRMIGKGDRARHLAIIQSMSVNTAYEILKTPLKRANYLLLLYGIKATDIKPSNDLLMEIMETREELADAVTLAALDVLSAKNTNNNVDIIAAISNAFHNGNIAEASELAIRLSYIHKIGEEIRLKKKDIFRKS